MFRLGSCSSDSRENRYLLKSSRNPWSNINTHTLSSLISYQYFIVFSRYFISHLLLNLFIKLSWLLLWIIMYENLLFLIFCLVGKIVCYWSRNVCLFLIVLGLLLAARGLSVVAVRLAIHLHQLLIAVASLCCVVQALSIQIFSRLQHSGLIAKGHGLAVLQHVDLLTRDCIHVVRISSDF